MSISHYIKIIGRGKDGARPITREEAADLWGQLLDGTVTDLETGAFCLAMRIKGEAVSELDRPGNGRLSGRHPPAAAPD